MSALPRRRRTAPHGGLEKRGAARLAAVQALYQIDQTGAPPEEVIVEFRRHRLSRDPAGGESAARIAPDAELFARIVGGAWERRGEIDALVAPVLAERWTLGRLDPVLRAALRAGTYELLALAEVPARVTINEYVNVARMFFTGKEPGFVNGALDRLARRLRPQEMAGEAAGKGVGGDKGA